MSAPFELQLNMAMHKILIFGYTRRLHYHMLRPTTLFDFIPDSVVSVISKHCGYKQCSNQAMSVWNNMIKEDAKHDEWDANSLHYSYKIHPNNKYILTRANDGDINPYCFGENIIDKYKSGIAIWKLKILQPELWYIGIINAQQVRKNAAWCQTNNEAYIVSTQDGYLYHAGTWKEQNKKYIIGHKKENIIFILYDFGKRTFSINFRGTFEKICDGIKRIKNNKKGYRLAIGMGPNCKIELLCSTQISYKYRKRKVSLNFMININWPQLKNKYEINVNRSTTIKKIKSIISQKEGIPAAKLTIVFKGKKMNDNDTLMGKGIKSGNTVHVMIMSQSHIQ